MYSTKPTYSWYAVYTKPNRESKIMAMLTEQKVECYLPLRKTLRQWSDRKKWIDEPLFRCYLFVRVSYIEYFTVLDSPGIVGYVSFGGKAQTIPESQIQSIKTLVANVENEFILTHDRIAKGALAEVLSGPLKGVQGEIVEICGQSRLLIRVDAMGSCLHANISHNEIKLVDPGNVEKDKLIQKSKINSGSQKFHKTTKKQKAVLRL